MAIAVPSLSLADLGYKAADHAARVFFVDRRTARGGAVSQRKPAVLGFFKEDPEAERTQRNPLGLKPFIAKWEGALEAVELPKKAMVEEGDLYIDLGVVARFEALKVGGNNAISVHFGNGERITLPITKDELLAWAEVRGITPTFDSGITANRESIILTEPAAPPALGVTMTGRAVVVGDPQ